MAQDNDVGDGMTLLQELNEVVKNNLPEDQPCSPSEQATSSNIRQRLKITAVKK